MRRTFETVGEINGEQFFWRKRCCETNSFRLEADIDRGKSERAKATAGASAAFTQQAMRRNFSICVICRSDLIAVMLMIDGLADMRMGMMVMHGRTAGNAVMMTFSAINHDGRGESLRGKRNHYQPQQCDFDKSKHFASIGQFISWNNATFFYLSPTFRCVLLPCGGPAVDRTHPECSARTNS